MKPLLFYLDFRLYFFIVMNKEKIYIVTCWQEVKLWQYQSKNLEN